MNADQLKERLLHLWQAHGKQVQEIGGLLWHLRFRLVKEGNGRKGKGFGAWVRANLHVSRRTADLWANAYGKQHKLKPPLERGSKGGMPVSKQWPVQLKFDSAERLASFRAAWKVLGDRATDVVYEAVMQAARKRPAGEKAKAHYVAASR